MQSFENARRLEKLELDIMTELRKAAPSTVRAFPVSIQQWGQEKLDVNGIYATNLGQFFFVDFGKDAGLTVRALENQRALDLVDLMGHMGVVGNRSSLDELIYDDPSSARPHLRLPPTGEAGEHGSDPGA
ncbi:MAG: hypothetical protein JWP91_3284 [Fibrobacteres bacterium]|nr:hypothetical protein [Fibrobacterota bacterium]